MRVELKQAVQIRDPDSKSGTIKIASFRSKIYLNRFEGKKAICSLNCNLYDRGLVARKWKRLVFEFCGNIPCPLLDLGFNMLERCFPHIYSITGMEGFNGELALVQFASLCVRRLTCANMGILLISFVIVFQHIRQ